MRKVPDLHDDAFARMRAVASHPEIVRITTAMGNLAGYDIPPDRAAVFLRFHAFITDPQPAYITDWRADPELEERWYHSHVDGVLRSVRGALAATHYHADRLADIEAGLTAIMHSNSKDLMKNVTMGVGNTLKMDIEYQAFVLAYRRCLDYLAVALASYFKTQVSSFRTLPRSICRSNMPNVALAVSQAHARHVEGLNFVLAEGRKSVRNRIAHYDFVSAGCVNLSARGFFLAGGGEELRRWGTLGT